MLQKLKTALGASTEAAADVRFVTLRGEEVDTVTRAQMREIDRVAVEETGPALLQMMEHAGRSLAVVAIKELPEPLPARRVLVIAGAGGNGGGGVCAARHLVGRVGRVDLCLAAPDGLSRAASHQLGTYRGTGGGEIPLDALNDSEPYDLVVDAVLGYGLRGEPSGGAARAIAWMAEVDAPVVSLDIPSGVDADSGHKPGVHVDARVTLTLHLPKPGLGSGAAGSLCLADLGIPESVSRRVGGAHPDYGPAFITRLRRV